MRMNESNLQHCFTHVEPTPPSPFLCSHSLNSPAVDKYWTIFPRHKLVNAGNLQFSTPHLLTPWFLFTVTKRPQKCCFYFLSPCKVACESSEFLYRSNTDYRADFFFLSGGGFTLKRKKHVFINIFYYICEKTTHFFELFHQILWL